MLTTSQYWSDWHMPQPEKNVYTVFEGINQIGSEMGYVVDYHNSNENMKISDDDIINTIEIASQYDIVIVVVGDNSMSINGIKKQLEKILQELILI